VISYDSRCDMQSATQIYKFRQFAMSVPPNRRQVLFITNQRDIHRMYRTVVGSFLLWEGHKLLKDSVAEMFETFNWFVFRYLCFLSTHNGLWELILQPLRKYECLETININFWNSSPLNVHFCDRCSQSGIVTETIL
jgi:hypothetical protein